MNINLDTIPATVTAAFVLMLISIWAIETLQQPSPEPTGPTYTFTTGGQWTTLHPAPH